MALTLSLSRLRMTTAKYFGKYNVASGTVTQVTAGAGITLTPNPIVATGTVAITAPVTVPLGGTGQTTFGAGYVLFGDAANSVKTDAKLFWNNTLKYLGVGGSPSYPLTVSDTVGATGVDNYASYHSLTKNAAEPVTNSVGLYGGVTLDLAGGATVANFGGIASRVRVINAGTGTQGANFTAVASVENTATWNSRIGYYVQETTGAGSLTDQYGIYIPALTKASGNNYAIFTAGATKSWFGGNLLCDANVGIGTAAPSYPVHVLATVGATGGGHRNINSEVNASAADVNARNGVFTQMNATNIAGAVGALCNYNSGVNCSGNGGTTAVAYTVLSQATVGAGHTLVQRNGLYVADATNTGTLTTQYGVNIASLTAAANNWAIYTGGTTPSYFGGATTFLTSVGVGHSSTPTRQIDLSGTQRFRGIAAPAVSEANSATMYFDSAANTLKASLNGSPYVNVIGSAGLTGSGDVTTSLPYWTTPTNLSYLHWIGVDQAFHRLGINTAAPAQELDVTGTVNTSGEYQIGYQAALGLDTTNHTLRVGEETPNYYGDNSVGIGHDALVSVTAGAGDGDNCTAVGAGALSAVTTGQANTAIGKDAGNTVTTGSNNIFIGTNADASAGNLLHACAIGSGATVADSYALSIGGGIQKVGIVTSAPKCALDVNGAFGIRQAEVTLVNGLNSDISSLTQSSWWRIVGPTGGFSVGGFFLGAASVADGFTLHIYNSTAQQMTIVNEDLSSTATMRVWTLTGGNVVLRAGTSAASFMYDSADDRWILISYN